MYSGESSLSELEDTEEEEEEEPALPYPGFVPISLNYLDQTSRPRNWCLYMITNPGGYLDWGEPGNHDVSAGLVITLFVVFTLGVLVGSYLERKRATRRVRGPNNPPRAAVHGPYRRITLLVPRPAHHFRNGRRLPITSPASDGLLDRRTCGTHQQTRHLRHIAN